MISAQSAQQPVRNVTDPGVITTRQTISPAGVQSVFDGHVYGITFGASPAEVWVLAATKEATPSLYQFDWRENRAVNRFVLPGAAGLQALALDPRTQSPLVGVTIPARAANNRAGGAVQLLRRDGAAFAPLAPDLGRYVVGSPALAISGTAATAVVPLTYEDAVAVVDANTGAVRGRVKTGGVAPFAAVVSKDARIAWVSNWGGRWPKEGDVTLPTGTAANADRVVVDSRGIASTGTVSRVDLDQLTVTGTVNVGLHPTALAWDEPRQRLYVANGNTDTISIIDTKSNTLAATMSVQPFGLRLKGVAPSALVVSPDGSRVYVALGGFNAVAVIDAAKRQTLGFIPTGWYPNHLALSADGTQLAVATLLGVGSGWQDAPDRRFVHAYRGTVSVLPVPSEDTLAAYSVAVAENNRVASAREQLSAAAANRVRPAPVPVPWRVGDPSTIEHVVYVIKENRTYDQILGDVPRGNGDPSMVLFGPNITPNHHKLATDFVVLDNFFATGGNSGDGHQWVTQANETSYTMWPGYGGRSYPFDGTDPIAYSSGGFLWDNAVARGRTVKVYGEYAGSMGESKPNERNILLNRWRQGEDFSRDWHTSAPLAPLNKLLASQYPSYSQTVPDVVRASILKQDIAQWTKDKSMPNLVVVQLPSDHTRGVIPGQSTPQAHLADNDWALGQIVDTLSHSPFWPKMAIFVVEDDAQAGVDHVDGHRTVALAISPFTRRGAVDSTFYAHQSMVKTIELILGLPAMSMFDLIATDMRASFTSTANLTPYASVEPAYSIYSVAPPAAKMSGPELDAARASARMRFDVPDAAPTELLNRLVWGYVRGWNATYPAVRRAAFSPFSIDVDDDDREEAREIAAARRRR